MSAQTPIAQLDADGLAEYLAQDFVLEPQGRKLELAGDALRFERETLHQHWEYCPGCKFCWPEAVQRESDI